MHITAILRLLDLVTLSTRCLYSIGPNLLEMLAGYEINLTKYQPLVDMQFGAPKLSSLVNNSLTFGTVMSAVCLFTKVLNQVSRILLIFQNIFLILFLF